MITRGQATAIALKHLADTGTGATLAEVLTIAEIRQRNIPEPICYSPFPLPDPSNCWFAFIHRPGHPVGASRLLCISMQTGALLAEGTSGE